VVNDLGKGVQAFFFDAVAISVVRGPGAPLPATKTHLQREWMGSSLTSCQGFFHLIIVYPTNHLEDVTTPGGVPEGFAGHEACFLSPECFQSPLIRGEDQVLARVLNLQLTVVVKEHGHTRLEPFPRACRLLTIVTCRVTDEKGLWRGLVMIYLLFFDS
jgi:hypothetical protein